MRGQHFAEYGNTKIQRAYCSRCKTTAFVIDSQLKCCDRLFEFESIEVKKMSIANPRRKTPCEDEKRAILEKQNGRCLYCGVSFGEIVFQGTRPFLLRINWDHMIPYAYSMDNRELNFCAACHVCNRIKSALMFQTLDEAIIYLKNVRVKKNYNF